MKRLSIFIAFLLLAIYSRAETIRISFLQDDLSLQNTVKVLETSGCAPASIARYQQAVHQYVKEPFDFDFGKFPKPVNGFYDFRSTQELLAALPHHLGKTRHAFDFNCMDLVIMTTEGQLQTSLKPDEIFGPFIVSTTTTNGDGVGFFANARDAFTCGYVPQYRDLTEASFPKPNQDSRMCLTACLYRLYLLPMATTEEKLDTEVMDVLRATWQRETVQFPQRFEIVFVHSADLNRNLISTDHAGVLFHSTAGYTYLEKTGGSGPYVRLDFKDKSDLVPWLAAAFLNPKPPSGHRYATFNADIIQNLDPK